MPRFDALLRVGSRRLPSRSDIARRGRVLALFVRLDRHAEGRAARACEPDGDREALRARACSASARATSCYSAGKLFFAYGLGNGMSFPMSVGATAVLLPDRPTPAAIFEVLQARAADAVFRRADALCGDAGRSGLHAGERLAAPAHVRLGRPRRCPSISGSNGRSASASTSLDGIGSTEMLHIFLSNQPGKLRYGTSGVPVPGYEAAARRRARAREVADGEVGELLGARHRRPRRATGTSARNRAAPSRASGRAPATNTCASRTACIATAAAPTTCSRCRGLWVSPFEVESALITHPRVLEAAVVAEGGRRRAAQAEGLHRAKDGAKRDDAPARSLKEHVKAACRPVEISALDRVRRRPAEDRDRQDPALQAEGLMTEARRPRPPRRRRRFARIPHDRAAARRGADHRDAA